MSIRSVSYMCVWVGCVVALPSLARAQAERPSATVLRSQLTGVEAGEGAAFDRTLRARLDSLDVVRTEGAVAMDLEETQLAMGCMGETAECLEPIADAEHTAILVIPSLARAGTTIVATVLVFDRRDGTIRRGTREASAIDASTLLGGVEALLREVFGLPAAAVVTHDATHDVAPTPTPPTPSPGLSIAPWVVIGGGAAALIAGAIAGGLSIADASTVQSAMPTTPADVDALDAIVSRQRTEATVADALLIGGAVIVVAGLVWELAAGREDGSSPFALAPMVSPTQLGLVVSGTFGGDL